MIDLRSDTITRPTAAMRRVMAEAPVGDDVFGDDPTVRLLEERFAGLFGKAAAVFVPSGTMANQLAIRAQTEPGDEVITHPESHVSLYESGAPAALSGVTLRYAEGPRGTFTAEEVRGCVRPRDAHYGPSALVAVENTHNRGGGRVWPLEQLRAVREECLRLGVRLHLDGARIWNAHVVSGVPLAEYGSLADTVSACFSKGLGAPVGSALAGDERTIARARRFRKMFGGMRQAGILTAACLYALDHHVARLGEDHAKARAGGAAGAGSGGVGRSGGGGDESRVFRGRSAIRRGGCGVRAARGGGGGRAVGGAAQDSCRNALGRDGG
ncbi:MAG: threonine aldolase family protein [Phycisphaerales bacterium]|nr:threonine aldolase family protein [Phycisphaerales bacterium]